MIISLGKVFRSREKQKFCTTKKLFLKGREIAKALIRDLIILWAFSSAMLENEQKHCSTGAGGGLKIVLMEKLLPHHHKNRRKISTKLWNIFISLRAIAIFDRKIFIVSRLMVSFWGWNNKRQQSEREQERTEDLKLSHVLMRAILRLLELSSAEIVCRGQKM